MSKSKMVKIEQINNKKVVIAKYIRVSTDKQREEGFSVDIQKERLDAYAKSLFMQTGVDVEYREYIDDGFTGATLDRPRMMDLIKDAEANIITHVMVVKLDRLSRSQKDTLHLIEDIFIPHNITFMSMSESFNTATSFGRAVLGILSVFAQLERENIYERTRSGMTKRVELGYWPGGGRVPFGYDYDKEQGIIVPNKDAVKVKQAYDLYLQGYSCQAISNLLGMKYDKLPEQILTRKSNTGVIVYNGVEYQGLHEPIISLETYEKTMAMMEERSVKKFVTKSPHLLTGLVYCGKCGAKMRYIKWGKLGYRFMCYSQQTTKQYLIKNPNCDNYRPFAKDVESAVINTVFYRAKNRIDSSIDSIKQDNIVDMLKEQEQVLQRKLKRLYDLYAVATDDSLLNTILELNKELKSIHAKIDSEVRIKVMSQNAVEANMQLDTLQDCWSYMTIFEQQNILRAIINKITVDDNNVNIDFKY